MTPPTPVACGSFDDIRLHHMRFLDAASRLGPLHVLLWSDELTTKINGQPPKFPLAERQYFLDSIRWVSAVTVIDNLRTTNIQSKENPLWVIDQTNDPSQLQTLREATDWKKQTYTQDDLAALPTINPIVKPSGRKKILLTGCYDWLHTGHVRFFEEVSEHGDVYAVVGHDANIELLKGAGHPQFPEEQRRYMVGSIKFVTQALISTGHGWLDAEPEIKAIKADAYAVNEDGDKPEKRKYCEENGLEYLVLKRTPKAGLPRRESTKLRGF